MFGLFTLFVTDNENVNVEIEGMEVTFTPAPNWNGTEILTFIVNDGQGRAAASTNTQVLVSSVNDAPVVISPLQDFSFEEDSSDSSINLFSVFNDVDLQYDDSLTFGFSGNNSIVVGINPENIVTLAPIDNWLAQKQLPLRLLTTSRKRFLRK